MDSLLAREKVANTFLGNGIAIPHGIPKDRELIRKTGVAVLQVPAGVEWNAGETVQLVVGIAAKSDEHLQILTNLTDVLGEPDEAARLAATKDAAQIVARLSGAAATEPGAAAGAVAAAPEDLAHGFDVMIDNPHGLHARPATAFVEFAKGFQATIRVRHGDQVADGKSLISLLKLGVECGSLLRVMAEGADAAQALAALREAIEKGLEDEAAAAAEATTPMFAARPAVRWEGRTAAGMSASPGLAIGTIWQFVRAKIVVAATARDPAAELKKLDRAIETAKRELAELYKEVGRSRGRQGRHLQGPRRVPGGPGDDRDGPGLDPRRAQRRLCLGTELRGPRRHLAAQKDALLAARAVDLRDVGRRVLKLLAERSRTNPSFPTSR